MRLFFVVDNNMPHSTGGGYYALFKFAEALAERGHQVTVYAVYDHKWVTQSNNLRLLYRPKIPRGNRFLRKMDKAVERLCDVFLLPFYVRRSSADWILGVLTYSAIKASRLGKKLGISVANFVYETPLWLQEVYGSERSRNEASAYLHDLWEETRSAYLASRVLFPNSELARRYASLWLHGKEIAPPVYPGVDQANMPYEIGVPYASLPHEILYVGRLARDKNVDLLIRAVLKIPAPPVLHVCGTGPESASLMKLAEGSGSIIFHGFVDDQDLWGLFRRCRLVVFPSSFEGFGMPPMQALYFGKPCLVTDLPIFRSIYGDYLEYCAPRDVADLSSKIQGLLANPQYCEMRGREGRAFVLSRFSWKMSAETVESGLQGITI